MSVKGKIKRLNREVEDLKDEIKYLKHILFVEESTHKYDVIFLENMIKFFVINQVGKPADGGVHIDEQYIDDLTDSGVQICYDSENKAYVIKLEEAEKDEKN